MDPKTNNQPNSTVEPIVPEVSTSTSPVKEQSSDDSSQNNVVSPIDSSISQQTVQDFTNSEKLADLIPTEPNIPSNNPNYTEQSNPRVNVDQEFIPDPPAPVITQLSEANWSGEADGASSGHLVGRKRILYIGTSSLALLIIVSGVVFGFVLPSKKSNTSISKADSGIQKSNSSSGNTNQSSTKKASTSSSSQAVAVSNTKKTVVADPPLPFSNESEDVLPVDNAVPESDPTNQPGDPITEPDSTDTQP